MTTYTITETERLEAMDALYLPSMKTEAMLKQKDKAYVMLQSLQPNTQEPTAWMQIDCIGERFLMFDEPYQPSPLKDKVDPLFTHQAAQQKPLTDAEIEKIFTDCVENHDSHPDWFARAIEAAHGVKP